MLKETLKIKEESFENQIRFLEEANQKKHMAIKEDSI